LSQPAAHPRRLTSNARAAVRIAVIIPVLNESENLERLLADLRRCTDVQLEICVADGGSSDDSVAVARRHGARVVQTPRGRGLQMNAARERTDAPWLLFLHADSRLLDPSMVRLAVDALRLETSRHGAVAGHFRLRFERPASGRDLAFRFLERKTGLNRPYTINGDQGVLISASFFDTLGGFDERLPFLEDQQLAARIRDRGRWISLPGVLRTSSRRFEAEGFARRYFVMAVIMAAWRAGVDEFFQIAPELYRVQDETDLLDVEPVIDALWETMRRIGPTRALRAWLDVGAFARENGWQLAFWLDTWVADQVGIDGDAFLRWWDEHLGGVEHPVVDAIVGLGVFAAVMCGVPLLGRIWTNPA
jgi:rSAM/selenodomain-associated transferase 2